MAYIGNQPVPQATQNRDSYTATASQTTFAVSGGYSIGFIDVFMNGVKLASTDFTASDGNTVVLASGAAAGDLIDIIAYDTFVAAQTTYTRSTFTATAAQTTFSVNYTVGFIDVFMNGVKLIVGTDVTATSGSDIVLASGAAAGDLIETIAYGTFSIANALITSDIGVTVQAYDPTIVVDADIGVTVQAYDADTTKNDVANTFTADQTISAELIADSYNESYNAVTSTSNATTGDCETGNVFSHTLTENTTFTFSNPPTSGTAYAFSLRVVQDASASGYTVTWPGSVDWPSATAPTLTATADAVDWFVFSTVDGGTTWYGFTSGQALA